MQDFQVREEHWVIADLIGKGKHIRTVLVRVWAKRAVDDWTTAAGINGGAIFRRVSRLGTIWGDGITPKAIWHIVKAAAKRAGISNLAPYFLTIAFFQGRLQRDVVVPALSEQPKSCLRESIAPLLNNGQTFRNPVMESLPTIRPVSRIPTNTCLIESGDPLTG